MIRVREIRKRYGTAHRGGREVLRGADLEVEQGELVVITGRSGSGKTTLLNIIGGLDGDYEGEVEVGGIRLGNLSDRDLSRYRNERVGFVFQAFHLLEHLDCLENVALPARFAKTRMTRHDLHRRAQALLERVELPDKLHAAAAQLSGGEKQRVAVARSLFQRPDLLLCDEPTGNLDEATANAIIDMFGELNRVDGMTVLIVSHDPRVTRVAQRVLALEEGRLHAPSPAPASRDGELPA